MAILGKVAGSMLKDNLVRNGVDLILDSNLMYWDVSNRRVGINTTMPGNTFTANGDSTLSNIYITNSNLYSLFGNLVLDSLMGNIEVNAKQIKNVLDPTEDQDAVTKYYVDSRLGSLKLEVGDTLSSNTDVFLRTERLILQGTQNQINANITAHDTVTFSLTDNVNIIGNLISGNVTTNISNANTVIADGVFANYIQAAEIGNINPGNGSFIKLFANSTITANGNIIAANTADSSSITTGSFVAAGGAGIAANLYVGGNINGNIFTNSFNWLTLGANSTTITSSSIDAPNSNSWIFDANSNITFPDGTLQFTAWNSSYIINLSNTEPSFDIMSGALTVAGGVGIGGNLNIGGNLQVPNITVNNLSIVDSISTVGNVNFLTANIGNLYVHDNSIDAINVDGNINLTPNGNGVIISNSTTAFKLPTGNNLARPANATQGMLRYNHAIAAVEVFDGRDWQTISSRPTVIVSDKFVGTGDQLEFELTQPSTTGGAIVTVNGVLQMPDTSYSVAGNVLTFTEAPVSTDIIEARLITTTQTVTDIVIGDSAVYFGGEETNYSINFDVDQTLRVNITYANTTILNNLVTTNGIFWPNGSIYNPSFTLTASPLSSKGMLGDIQGMMSVDSTNIYYCIATYTTGTDDIWVKSPWAVTTSWP